MGGNLYRAPYYNGNPNIGPRIIENLDQSPNYLKQQLSVQRSRSCPEVEALRPPVSDSRNPGAKGFGDWGEVNYGGYIGIMEKKMETTI